MKNFKWKINNEEGVALILVLLVLIVVGGLTVSLMTAYNSNIKITSNTAERNKAFYAAESGVNYLDQYIKENSSLIGFNMEAIKSDLSKINIMDFEVYIDDYKDLGNNLHRFDVKAEKEDNKKLYDIISVQYEVYGYYDYFQHARMANKIIIEDSSFGSKFPKDSFATAESFEESDFNGIFNKTSGIVNYNKNVLPTRDEYDYIKNVVNIFNEEQGNLGGQVYENGVDFVNGELEGPYILIDDDINLVSTKTIKFSPLIKRDSNGVLHVMINGDTNLYNNLNFEYDSTDHNLPTWNSQIYGIGTSVVRNNKVYKAIDKSYQEKYLNPHPKNGRNSGSYWKEIFENTSNSSKWSNAKKYKPGDIVYTGFWFWKDHFKYIGDIENIEIAQSKPGTTAGSKYWEYIYEIPDDINIILYSTGDFNYNGGYISPKSNVNLAYFAPFSEIAFEDTGSTYIVSSMIVDKLKYIRSDVTRSEYDTSTDNPIRDTINPKIAELSLAHSSGGSNSGAIFKHVRIKWNY